jgi:hypothetical protein
LSFLNGLASLSVFYDEYLWMKIYEQTTYLSDLNVIQMHCEYGNLHEQCDFNTKFPIFLNQHHRMKRQVFTFFLPAQGFQLVSDSFEARYPLHESVSVASITMQQYSKVLKTTLNNICIVVSEVNRVFISLFVFAI